MEKEKLLDFCIKYAIEMNVSFTMSKIILNDNSILNGFLHVGANDELENGKFRFIEKILGVDDQDYVLIDCQNIKQVILRRLIGVPTKNPTEIVIDSIS